MAVLVQTYFAFRISYLTRSNLRWWLTSLIMLFVVAHFAKVETVVLTFIEKEFSALSQITFYAMTPFAITAVLSDIFIAASLCILLHGNRSPIVETNALVNTLIVYAINRCLLTSVVAVAEVTVVSSAQGSLWFIAIDFVIGKRECRSTILG
ncbi:hypothetical protein EDB19DRAFT_1674288 [Suillus lakei]|nr:hypothetical protein EDB19DRAFT_1674288 [Suillus lakei]